MATHRRALSRATVIRRVSWTVAATGFSQRTWQPFSRARQVGGVNMDRRGNDREFGAAALKEICHVRHKWESRARQSSSRYGQCSGKGRRRLRADSAACRGVEQSPKIDRSHPADSGEDDRDGSFGAHVTRGLREGRRSRNIFVFFPEAERFDLETPEG